MIGGNDGTGGNPRQAGADRDGPRRAAVAPTAPRERGGPRRMVACLLAVVSLVAFTGFFGFHQGRFTHFGENFHYQLGSKYFPELGYDGLYDASVAAQEESDPKLPLPATVRDLRTNSIVPVAVARRPIGTRFASASAPSGGGTSSATTGTSSTGGRCASLTRLRLDHGYNPSPTPGRSSGDCSTRGCRSTRRRFLCMALLDWVLIAVALVAVRRHRTGSGRHRGVRDTCSSLGYPWGYASVGGAFLRYRLVCGRRRGHLHARSQASRHCRGALLAYATAVRDLSGPSPGRQSA